jgi:hypothetical protein
MEAACFQTKAILDAMEKDSGKKLTELAVDGGMSNSDICMQVRLSCQLSIPFQSLIPALLYRHKPISFRSPSNDRRCMKPPP